MRSKNAVASSGVADGHSSGQPLAPTAEGEYYVFQLVGLRVEEDGGGELGRVADVLPGVANDVLELDSGLALPMVEDCVLAVDVEAGRILIAPGFVDLN